MRIIRAWTRTILGLDKKLSRKRLAICTECDKVKKSKLGFYQCGVCGCPLIAKTRDYDESCPHPNGAKW